MVRTGGRTVILGVDKFVIDILARGLVSGITGGWKDMEDAPEAVRGRWYMGSLGLEVIILADCVPCYHNHSKSWVTLRTWSLR